jgi:hypothetical protein
MATSGNRLTALDHAFGPPGNGRVGMAPCYNQRLGAHARALWERRIEGLLSRLLRDGWWLALASVLLLYAADSVATFARVEADGVWDAGVLRDWGRFRDETQSRGGNDNAAIVLKGLGRREMVRVLIGLRAPIGGYTIAVDANGKRATQLVPSGVLEHVPFTGTSDGAGHLVLRLRRLDDLPVKVFIQDVSVTLERSWLRCRPCLQWLQFGVIGVALGWLTRRSGWLVRALALLGVALVATGILAVRLHAFDYLPLVAWALGLAASWGLIEGRLTEPGTERLAARFALAMLIARLLLVMRPEFTGIDLGFQVQNMMRYKDGQLIASAAPGVAVVWYPVALYALLSPMCSADTLQNFATMRAAFLVMEAAGALLILALLRAAGASRVAGICAAATYLALPEGLLVAIKGSATNELGNVATIAVLWALVARRHLVWVAGLATLMLLSHSGAAVLGVLLFGIWGLEQRRRGEIDTRQVLLRAGGLLLALGVAWVVYYRHVPLVLSGDRAWFGRWYRLGKIAQNLLLKFGGAPLVLAFIGLRVARSPLSGLAASWLATSVAMAIVAVLSPYPLRFELFAAPAVALLAGLGAEKLAGEGRGRWVGAAWLCAACVQLTVGLAHLWDHFYPIAVIMESPRWPFPFHL